MNTLLRIDASSRSSASQSRALGDHFESEWLNRHPDTRVVRRDVVANTLPHIDEQTITGFYTPVEQLTTALQKATALSDQLIAELRAADTLLITTPMYNFSMPSALKAWFDHVMRIGQTFAFDGREFSGLVTGKRAYVVCAQGLGGYHDHGPFAGHDFLKPYLKLLLNFIGIHDVNILDIESTVMDAATVARNTKLVQHEIDRAVAAA